jgi:hypothetical protein
MRRHDIPTLIFFAVIFVTSISIGLYTYFTARPMQ